MTDPSPPLFNMTIGNAPVKFVWFRIAKCGTRSTLKLLRDYDLMDDLEHVFQKRYQRRKLAEHASFAIVRNPYTRLVSGWNDKIVLNNPGFREIGEDQKVKMQDFAYFVDWLVDQGPRKVNIHFRRQSLLVPRDVDHLGYIENFDHDLKEILKKVGFSKLGKIPHHNRHPAPDLNHLYTTRILQLVNDYYAHDFRHFGYNVHV